MKNIMQIPYGDLTHKIIRLEGKSPEEIIDYYISLKNRLNENDSIVNVIASSNQRSLVCLEATLLDDKVSFLLKIAGGDLNTICGLTLIIETELKEKRLINCSIPVVSNPVSGNCCTSILMGQAGRSGTTVVSDDIIYDDTISVPFVTNIGTDTDAILQFTMPPALKGADAIPPIFKINSVKSVDNGTESSVNITQDSSNPNLWLLDFYLERGVDGDGIVFVDGIPDDSTIKVGISAIDKNTGNIYTPVLQDDNSYKYIYQGNVSSLPSSSYIKYDEFPTNIDVKTKNKFLVTAGDLTDKNNNISLDQITGLKEGDSFEIIVVDAPRSEDNTYDFNKLGVNISYFFESKTGGIGITTETNNSKYILTNQNTISLLIGESLKLTLVKLKSMLGNVYTSVYTQSNDAIRNSNYKYYFSDAALPDDLTLQDNAQEGEIRISSTAIGVYTRIQEKPKVVKWVTYPSLDAIPYFKNNGTEILDVLKIKSDSSKVTTDGLGNLNVTSVKVSSHLDVDTTALTTNDVGRMSWNIASNKPTTWLGTEWNNVVLDNQRAERLVSTTVALYNLSFIDGCNGNINFPNMWGASYGGRTQNNGVTFRYFEKSRTGAERKAIETEIANEITDPAKKATELEKIANKTYSDSVSNGLYPGYNMFQIYNRNKVSNLNNYCFDGSIINKGALITGKISSFTDDTYLEEGAIGLNDCNKLSYFDKQKKDWYTFVSNSGKENLLVNSINSDNGKVVTDGDGNLVISGQEISPDINNKITVMLTGSKSINSPIPTDTVILNQNYYNVNITPTQNYSVSTDDVTMSVATGGINFNFDTNNDGAGVLDFQDTLMYFELDNDPPIGLNICNIGSWDKIIFAIDYNFKDIKNIDISYNSSNQKLELNYLNTDGSKTLITSFGWVNPKNPNVVPNISIIEDRNTYTTENVSISKNSITLNGNPVFYNDGLTDKYLRLPVYNSASVSNTSLKSADLFAGGFGSLLTYRKVDQSLNSLGFIIFSGGVLLSESEANETPIFIISSKTLTMVTNCLSFSLNDSGDTIYLKNDRALRSKKINQELSISVEIQIPTDETPSDEVYKYRFISGYSPSTDPDNMQGFTARLIDTTTGKLVNMKTTKLPDINITYLVMTTKPEL